MRDSNQKSSILQNVKVKMKEVVWILARKIFLVRSTAVTTIRASAQVSKTKWNCLPFPLGKQWRKHTGVSEINPEKKSMSGLKKCCRMLALPVISS